MVNVLFLWTLRIMAKKILCFLVLSICFLLLAKVLTHDCVVVGPLWKLCPLQCITCPLKRIENFIHKWDKRKRSYSFSHNYARVKKNTTSLSLCTCVTFRIIYLVSFILFSLLSCWIQLIVLLGSQQRLNKLRHNIKAHGKDRRVNRV